MRRWHVQPPLSVVHMHASSFVRAFCRLIVDWYACLRGRRVENPHVKVDFLKGTTPDTVRGDVEAGSCLGVGHGSCQYIVGHRLKFGLDAHLLAHFSEEGAVRPHISLCLIDGKPPLAQDSACSTEKVEPQARLAGNLSGVQPYHSARASWKAPLCNAKPNSESGRTVSQVEEPFSLASFTDLCKPAGRRSRAACELFSLFSFLTRALDSNCLAMTSYL